MIHFKPEPLASMAEFFDPIIVYPFPGEPARPAPAPRPGERGEGPPAPDAPEAEGPGDPPR